nr:MAG TPA: hypothetical protein [Caudoviricetes sp.]
MSLRDRKKNLRLQTLLMSGLEKPLELLHNGLKTRDCLT